MPLSKDSQMTILLLHLPKTFLSRVWERSGSGSARHFGTGEAGAAPNGHSTGAAPGHLQEELEPFLGCIGGAANSGSGSARGALSE